MNTGAQHFEKIRGLRGFVDKSMLIKTIINTPDEIILLTAPRRFGKTINLSMIKRFFELLPNEETMERNRKLFEGLLIDKYQNITKGHQGMHPVIFLDFKSNDLVLSLAVARRKISRVVQIAYQAHKYLSSSDKLTDKEKVKAWCDRTLEENPVNTNEDIYDALENLAIYLFKH